MLESYRSLQLKKILHNLILVCTTDVRFSSLYCPSTVCLFCIQCLSFHRPLHFLLIGIRCIFLERHTSTYPAVQQQGVQAKAGFNYLVNTQSDASVWKYSPAKAEEGKVDAQQCGHHMSHKRTCLAGVQIEPEPHGREKCTELTYYEVHLKKKKKRLKPSCSKG